MGVITAALLGASATYLLAAFIATHVTGVAFNTTSEAPVIVWGPVSRARRPLPVTCMPAVVLLLPHIWSASTEAFGPTSKPYVAESRIHASYIAAYPLE